jgi:hypothetical protein
MKFFSIASTALALMASMLLSLSAVHAGTLNTPIIFLGSGTQLVCIANNVTASPIAVVVRIVGQSTTTTQSCNLPAGDRNGCQAFKNGESGHCSITMSNLTNAEVAQRVRGVMFSRKTVAPFAMEGTVQAQ